MRSLAAGTAALLLAGLAACSAPASPEASGPPGRPHAAASAPALPSGAPRLAAAFTVPGGGLVNEAQFSADGKLAATAWNSTPAGGR